MKPNVVVIHEMDNVGIALEVIKQGDEVQIAEGACFAALEEVPFSHKVALVQFSKGDEVRKYGEVIGRCSRDISRGEWVHTHNLGMDIEGSR
jgi:hypothetical protein